MTFTYELTKTSYTIGGLSNGTCYKFLVQSYSALGWSAFSESDIVTAIPTASSSGASSANDAMLADLGYSIMGDSPFTISQFVSAFNARNNAYPSSTYSSKGAPTIEDFCRILIQQARTEGVKAEVVFAQAMLETGWLRFGGDVRAEQCNFAGLGATGGGESGNVFPDVSTGLLAQVQHLKAYASTEPLSSPCVDQRYSAVISTYGMGSAPTVQALSEKWAADSSYGEKILAIIYSL